MEIPLSNGGVVLVNDDDYPLVAGFTWRRQTDKRGPKRSNYAVCPKLVEGKVCAIYMHRIILPLDPPMTVDHINGNGLDNRRCNLRPATLSQNRANGIPPKPSSTGFRGVYRYKGQRFYAGISNGGHSMRSLGSFDDPVQAALAYDQAALLRWGPFARLNLPGVSRDR